MNIAEITRFARIKGLNLVGTGDFTHPRWLGELTEDLFGAPGTSLYRLVKEPKSTVHYMITGEVSTIFAFQGEVKKIHHVILTPSLEIATQINDRLALYGNLSSDGRPTLDMTAPQLVEEIMQISNENVVIPAHAWTPWFSLFGAFSGFNRVEDCYQDTTKYILALETGLSSDPPMNWRLSSLDQFTLISNSDSHSPWPWRIGREANVFELERLTFKQVVDAIRKKDPNHFRFTIETNPAYGKYHWTGHRNCNIALSPQEAMKFGNRCPICRKKLTMGVEQRVEELADRKVGFNPANSIGFIHLLPLSEIIATTLGVHYPSVQKVWEIYNVLVAKFGDEYAVLIDAKVEEMTDIVEPKVAEAIVRVREGKIKVHPGYDGVYGQLVIADEAPEVEETTKASEPKKEQIAQRSLADFI